MLYVGEIAVGSPAPIYTAPRPSPGIPFSGKNVTIDFIRVTNESGSAQTFTLYATVGNSTAAITPVDTQLPIGAMWDDIPIFAIPPGAIISASASAAAVKYSVNAIL